MADPATYPVDRPADALGKALQNERAAREAARQAGEAVRAERDEREQEGRQ